MPLALLRQIIKVLLFAASAVFGYTLRDLNCSSYRHLYDQYRRCTNMRPSTDDMSTIEDIFWDERLTKEELTKLAKMICRSYVPSEVEKRCVRIKCVSDTEMTEILNKYGGICDGNETVLQQAYDLLSDFQSVTISEACTTETRNRIDSCFSTGSSEIPNRPDSSLNIQDGISWWETDRKRSIGCIIEALKTMPTSCGRIRDIQIYNVFDTVLTEPTGVGAHVDLAPFIGRLSSN